MYISEIIFILNILYGELIRKASFILYIFVLFVTLILIIFKKVVQRLQINSFQYIKSKFNYFYNFKNPFKKLDNNSLVIDILSLMLSIFAMIFVISIRFKNMYSPQGFDTGIYIYNIQKIENGDIIPVLFSTKGISYLILWISYRLFSYSNYIQAAILFPYVAGFVYIFLIWLSVKIGYNDKFLLFLIPITSLFSFYFIRVSYDLLSQTIGLGFLFLLLVTLGKSDTIKLYNIKVLFLLLCLFFAHFYTAMFAMLFIILFEFYKLYNKNNSKFIIYMLLLSIIVIFFVILQWDRINWIFTVIVSNEFNFGNISLSSFWFAFNENSLIWITSIFGIIFMFIRKNKEDNIFLLWAYYVLAICFITGYVQLYRILLLLPIGFYSAMGVEYFVLLILNIKDIKFKNERKLFAVLFISFFTIGLINYTTYRGYIPEYVYFPDNYTMQQINWIYTRYGFSNSNIIVPIFNPSANSISNTSSSNVYTWSKAFLGDSIYIGNLFDILNNKTDKFGKSFNFFNKTIILSSKLYQLTDFEKNISTKISNLGIYSIYIKNKNQLEQIFISHSIWYINNFKNFYDEWKIITDTLHPNTYINNTFLLNFTGYFKKGWYTFEHYFDQPINTSKLNLLILILRGNLASIKMWIEFYNYNIAFESITYNQSVVHFIYFPIYILSNCILEHIRIVIKNSYEGYLYDFLEFKSFILI